MCQLFVQAGQQISKGRHPRLARVLDAGWKGVYTVEVADKLHKKEKEMSKAPPKAGPKTGKGKEKEKEGTTAAK